jgi:hypothetical protein
MRSKWIWAVVIGVLEHRGAAGNRAASAGPEHFGNKFPGEAAVYTGIAHVAI